MSTPLEPPTLPLSPTQTDDSVWQGALLQALATPHGLLLRVTDFEQARRKLYKLKQALPHGAMLSIRRGLEPDLIMIVRGRSALATALKEAAQ